jgi:hypothetical protein
MGQPSASSRWVAAWDSFPLDGFIGGVLALVVCVIGIAASSNTWLYKPLTALAFLALIGIAVEWTRRHQVGAEKTALRALLTGACVFVLIFGATAIIWNVVVRNPNGQLAKALGAPTSITPHGSFSYRVIHRHPRAKATPMTITPTPLPITPSPELTPVPKAFPIANPTRKPRPTPWPTSPHSPSSTPSSPPPESPSVINVWIDGPTSTDPKTSVDLRNIVNNATAQDLRIWGYVNLTADAPFNVNNVRAATCAHIPWFYPTAQSTATVEHILAATHPLPYALSATSRIQQIYIYWVYTNPATGKDQDYADLFQFDQSIPGYRSVFVRNDRNLLALRATARLMCQYNG